MDLLRTHAGGADLSTLFDKVLDLVEREIDGAMGSVLLADRRKQTLTAAAGRHLPDGYLRQIVDAPIGNYGTCARAAHNKSRVIVADTETDLSWRGSEDLIEEFGLRAAWSQPFFDPDLELLGTLGLYFETPREPSPEELDVLGVAAYLLGLFISREQAIESLSESEEKFRTLVENASDTLLLLTEEAYIEYAAPNVHRILGGDAEVWLGQPFDELVADVEAQRLRGAMVSVLTSGEQAVLEEVRSMAGAPARWIRCALAPRGDGKAGLVAVLADVTQRRIVESQLQFAERMTTVGTLAAGVAHEINNPVAYVSGNLAYLYDRLASDFGDEVDDDLFEAVRDAIDGTRRVGEIVSDLKAFTGSRGREPEPVDLAEVINSSVRLTRPQLHSNTFIETDVGAGLMVFGNGTELGQIVVNLIVNAVQAMDDEPGTIGVSARVRADEHVELVVRDEGPGMPADVLSRIFEPFFTTKDPDRGTGLGLAIVHGIVKRHGATIDVESTPGEGTRFTIVFPPLSETSLRESDDLDMLRALRILFVDDEVALGRSVSRLLTRHEVHVESTCAGALELLATDRSFDLIMLDLMMPEMSGAALYQTIVERWPELESRITFVSGGAVSQESRTILSEHPERFLAKPFSRKEISRFIAAHAP
jgi:PAS domain S-box-containing protein